MIGEKMKKNFYLVLCFLLGFFLLGCDGINGKIENEAAVSLDEGIARRISVQEQMANRALEAELRGPQGAILYKNKLSPDEAYSLSESMGQMMEYAAAVQDRKLFDYYARVLQRYFFVEHKYYAWKMMPESQHIEKANALVDDLRFAHAYLAANKNFNQAYEKELKELSSILLSTDVNSDGYPVDFYDGNSKKMADRVSLFYLDTVTMRELMEINQGWQQPYLQANGILAHMPENTCGFYPQYYLIKEAEYQWGSSINMVENIYTAINAFKAGKGTVLFKEFLKKEITKGRIYNSYTLEGNPEGTDESTAVYALAARFLYMQQENTAAQWCYERMKQFQIQEGSMQGAFGDGKEGIVYAFDQCEALLTMRMVEMNNVER